MAELTFRLPDIGEGIAEAELAAWLVKPGDLVQEDDPICEVTTDKATVEIPASAGGRVTWLGGKAGDVLAIGADLIRIEITADAPAAAEVPALERVADPVSAAPVAAHRCLRSRARHAGGARPRLPLRVHAPRARRAHRACRGSRPWAGIVTLAAPWGRRGLIDWPVSTPRRFSMITLCGFAVSNYYNKVKLALLEKGVAFTEEEVKTGRTDEAVLAASPVPPPPPHRGERVRVAIPVDYSLSFIERFF